MAAVRLLPTLLFLLALCAPAAAQGTPEAAAESYLAHMRAGDWSRTATLMHPEALSELKGFFAEVAAADSGGAFLRPLFGVRTPVEFDAMSSAEVYARMLRAATAGNRPVAEAMRGMRTEVLGSVREGDDLAHVVYRIQMTVNEVPVSKMEVLTVRRSGDRWLALLTGDLKSMAQAFTRALQRQP